MSEMTTNDALNLWHNTIIRSLRELPYDLSQRQIGVLLSVYMSPPPHTIRSISEALNISKPAICRAVDTLSMLDLIRRKKDDADRRTVFLQRTINGSVFLRDFADIIVEVTKNNAIAYPSIMPDIIANSNA
jgi:DNA-binding MarR family transcriptional regulator